MVKKRPVLKKTYVKKRVSYQTGKRTGQYKGSIDGRRKALPPGQRISKFGKNYTETRRNRSDKKRTGPRGSWL